MKILVTGAAGQLGADLVPALKTAGHEVLGLSSAELDITAASAVEEAVNKYSPSVIVNCGAYTKVDLAEKEKERAYAVNRDGAANIAGVAMMFGAALVHISTDFVFDGRTPAPYREDSPANPLSVYGDSKLKGEAEIAKRLEEHFIIRTSWLYGAGGGNFVKTILRLASERETLRVVYDQTGTPTWTVDLAGAVVRVVERSESGARAYGVYHYSGEGVASWYDFAVAVVEEAASLGAPLKCARIEPILTVEYPTPAARPAYSVLDKKKIRSTFGLSIPHWRSSLKRMIKELYGGKDA
jgi:dTDP-4-dehydrorhamnose reductase